MALSSHLKVSSLHAFCGNNCVFVEKNVIRDTCFVWKQFIGSVLSYFDSQKSQESGLSDEYYICDVKCENSFLVQTGGLNRNNFVKNPDL